MPNQKENKLDSLQETYSDEISITDIFLALWKKRGKIIVWSIIFAVIISAIGGVNFLTQSKYSVYKLNFYLNFTGLQDGEYPNGSRFSTNDIISVTVLRKVYKENKLGNYYRNFSDFQKDISVYRENFMLTILRAEYDTKFDDKKLTVEERDKLEIEFQRKKKELLNQSEYSLALAMESHTEQMPAILGSKVLKDILRNWLDNAERQKGVNKYRVSLLTSNLITEKDIEELDYIVGVDLLRKAANAISEDLQKIEKLPGANIISIKTFDGETSISNLSFRLNFIRQFELEPLLGAIRTYGVTKEGPLSMIYLKTKLYELERERNAVLAIRQTYFETLNKQVAKNRIDSVEKGQAGLTSNSSTIIPQFDGTFFDKIVNMVEGNANIEYNQKLTDNEISAALNSINLEKEISYYTSLYEAFKKFKRANEQASSANKTKLTSMEALITQKQLKVLNSFVNMIKDLNSFYNKINEYSLNSQSEFYRVTSFVSEPIGSINLKKVLIVMILSWALAEALIVAGIIFSSKFAETKN
jgi:hypothetical protein